MSAVMHYPDVSVVVPVFNASPTLPTLVERVEQVLSARCENFELILVDDGSHDSSWLVINELAKEFAWVRGVKLAKNMGQHAATLVGLRRARYPIAITMDDDLQHPPETIPVLLDALTPDTDIVYAAPEAVPFSFYRSLVILAKYMVAVASGSMFIRHMRSFRGLRTALYPWAYVPVGPWSGLDGLLKYVHPRVKSVHVPYMPRMAGCSNYTLKRSTKLMFMLWRSAFQKPGAQQQNDALIIERISLQN